MFVAVFKLSYVPPETVHPTLPHVDRVLFVKVQMNQVPFRLCWPCINVINEKYHPLLFQCNYLTGIVF